jgi:hypothetical protein
MPTKESSPDPQLQVTRTSSITVPGVEPTANLAQSGVNPVTSSLRKGEGEDAVPEDKAESVCIPHGSCIAIHLDESRRMNGSRTTGSMILGTRATGLRAKR